MNLKAKFTTPLFLAMTFLIQKNALSQSSAQHSWDSVKNATMPEVMPKFKSLYSTPYRQPLADYGWEDGLQISLDGLSLYCQYFPGDLLSYDYFFVDSFSYYNGLSEPCKVLGNMSYKRSYAKTYGMNLKDYLFGCDSFANINILYAHRASLADTFKTWQLSGLAAPDTIEGGSDPLFSTTNSALVDIFLFTRNNDIWMRKNTGANPDSIEKATRLPTPINPVSNEFNADNPISIRLNNSDTLVLVYEKYTNAADRTFMYCFSYDNAVTFTSPVAMTTIAYSAGHFVTQPQLYLGAGNQWYLYYNLNNYFICRSKQGITGNWDSWMASDTILSAGNAISIAEPSLTTTGDISFSVAYKDSLNPHDVYDLDPWYLPHTSITTIVPVNKNAETEMTIYPNPVKDILYVSIRSSTEYHVKIFDLVGQIVFDSYKTTNQFSIDVSGLLSSSLYFIQISAENFRTTKKFTKL